MSRSASYQLADIRTEGRLAEIVGKARSAGESWRTIARDLYTRYDVDISDETLRIWFGDQVEQS